MGSRILFKILFTVILFQLVQSSSAETIYKWTDANGKEVFSSKKDDPRAMAAELPAIKKEKVKKINTAPASCLKHGGNDCNKGSDKDGSVICLDGFLDSAVRYNFVCSEALVKIDKISPDKSANVTTVFVRNDSPVTAKDVVLAFRDKHDIKGTSSIVRADGPRNIEQHQLATYTFKKDLNIIADNLVLHCENCR